MLKNIAQKFTASVYLAYARFKDQDDVIDVADHLSRITTALILPPEASDDFTTAIRVLDDLRQCFTQTQFYMLTPKALTDMIALDEQVQVISYEPEQISFHGLPRNDLQDAIRSRHFDMVIDLNSDFNLIATFLCRVSEAKLRICLQHPDRDPFYNFQVRATNGDSLENKYQSLLKYISVFTNTFPRRHSPPAEISLR
jgi:ADP-heptose:LPS heptosyltransferase